MSCGYEADARDVLFESIDGFNDVNYGRPGSYADKAWVGGKVFFDGLGCGGAFGLFDVVRHGAGGADGCGGEGKRR